MPLATAPPLIIIWAGLQGNQPKYIDQGDMKGMGYLEMPTKEVRAALSEAGFKLDYQYFTEARIEKEFRNKTPMCIYPVEWKPSIEDFTKKRDRIYSIPLNFGGEEVRRIIFRKGERAKFEKHIDEKGDLDVKALIQDPGLTSIFPEGAKVSDQFRPIFIDDAKGRAQIKPEYANRFSQVVPSFRDQLIQMLSAILCLDLAGLGS